jgi:hypothetical protein
LTKLNVKKLSLYLHIQRPRPEPALAQAGRHILVLWRR